MRLYSLLLLELKRRPQELFACGLAIVLAVGTVVAAGTVVQASSESLRRQVHELGANMLILPAGVEVSDYYAADFGDDVMPENYASRLVSSEVRDKVHNVVPRLARRLVIAGQDAILSGVLPQADLQSHASWRTANDFRHGNGPAAPETANHCSSREAPPAPVAAKVVKPPSLPGLQRVQVAQSLGRQEARLGSDFAHRAGLVAGDALTVAGRRLTVTEIAEPTGTVDDLRVFVHLERAQEILGLGRVLNAMEVVGCGCSVDLVALGEDLERILPGTQVVTVRNIADTQWNTTRLMARYAAALAAVLFVLAAGAIVNMVSANAVERRRELGMLLAVGACPRTVLGLFVAKAATLGAVGGVVGFAVGALAGVCLGERFGGAVALPPFRWLAPAMAGAVLFATAAAWQPAARAAAADPALLMEET